MIKKRIIGAIISMIFVAVLGIGVLHYSGYSLQDFIGETASEELEEFFDENGIFKPAKEETKQAINDLSKAYGIILDKGTREFYEGYPVDQAFLMWLNKRFGDETIMDMAYRMYEGYWGNDLWYRETGNTLHVLWLMYCEEKQYATYNLKNVHWMESAEGDTITIDFTGDINLADDWHTMQEAVTRENGIYDCISPEIVKELQSADVSVINNEFVFTDDDSNRQRDKAYTFGAKTANVTMLEAFSADLANLANNHAYDYRAPGLIDTIATLENEGIITMGAGENLEEAKAIQYLIVKGRKIAFVSATEIERYTNYTKQATTTEAGVLKTKDLTIYEGVIREAAENSDYVIANIHWGNEGSFSYSGAQYNMAAKLVAAGADAVIGGHPHRLQGIEYINNTPVAFSLGNFWFSTGTLYTTIAQIEIDKDGDLALRMIPCLQKDLTTTMLSNTEAVDFYKFVADVSKNIAIDADGYIYNTANEQTDEQMRDAVYRSGMSYATYTGLKDLEDRRIDIVGNLQ